MEPKVFWGIKMKAKLSDQEFMLLELRMFQNLSKVYYSEG